MTVVQFYFSRVAAEAIDIDGLKFRARDCGIPHGMVEMRIHRSGGRVRVPMNYEVAELLVEERRALAMKRPTANPGRVHQRLRRTRARNRGRERADSARSIGCRAWHPRDLRLTRPLRLNRVTIGGSVSAFKYRVEAGIGPWRLLESLGVGGHGEVWKADRGDGRAMALKILREGGNYARFRAEVDVLERLGERAGVLPIFDSSLPTRPTREDPAWLAMPIAKRLRTALDDDRSFDRICGAIAKIARTLADLHALDIAHRDIKPGNLYWYNGSAAIGDFGLVSFPDKRDLTAPGRHVGPMFFLAPEMIEHPETADPRRADVYSLAKTLYVFLAAREFPPQGPQRMDDQSVSLYEMWNDQRARQIDWLLQRSTQNTPTFRPTANDFAAELEMILQPRAVAAAPTDLSDIRSLVRVAFAPAERAAARKARYHEAAERMAYRAEGALKAR